MIGIGTLHNCSSKLVIISAYIAPKTTVPQSRATLEHINNAILQAKHDMNDPLIIVGGDFNKRDLELAVGDFPDVKIVPTRPTRGNEVLDIVATNFEELVPEVRDPLTTEDGRPSDHKTIHIRANTLNSDRFTISRIEYRPKTKRGDKLFKRWIEQQSWTEVTHTNNASEKAAVLMGMFEQAITDFYPMKTKKIKSTDDPWITPEIKRHIRTRKRIFERERRGIDWMAKKKETDDMIRGSKKDYYEKFTSLAKENNDPSLYFKVINRLKDRQAPKPFSPTDLYKGKSDAQVAEIAADFFTEITANFTPIIPSVRSGLLSPGTRIEEKDVVKRLKECKKPAGRLFGDLFPGLLREHVHRIGKPLTNIINACLDQTEWPDVWKEEIVSIIPKRTSPESLGDTRNISCTSVFSKLLEYFVLRDLKREVKIKPNQFGGVAKCSTDHYLAETWTTIMQALDQENSACCMISLDFAKAFNSMCHNACMRALDKLGASQRSLRMTEAFLTNRGMRFKVNGVLSTRRHLKGGAPQGTLMGNFLFIAATDHLDEKEEIPGENTATPTTQPRSEGSFERGPNITSDESHSTSLSDTSSDPEISYFGRSRLINRIVDSDTSTESVALGERMALNPPPPSWIPVDDVVLKYVDDLISIEKVHTGSSKLVISTARQKSEIIATGCKDFFTRVKEAAEQIGMKMNDGKTQLICVSASTSSDVDSYIRTTTGHTIRSQKSMKQLGFHFGARPTLSEHIEQMKMKFRGRLWLLRHLQKADVPTEDLVKMYKCFLLSILDYASVVYHPLLSGDQANQIEGLQRSALKIIFGFRKKYSEIMDEQEGVLEYLTDQRQQMVDNFITKTAANPQFADRWFPKRAIVGHDLRRDVFYHEEYARTSRLYNAPIYFYRRRLNQIHRPKVGEDEHIQLL